MQTALDIKREWDTKRKERQARMGDRRTIDPPKNLLLEEWFRETLREDLRAELADFREEVASIVQVMRSDVHALDYSVGVLREQIKDALNIPYKEGEEPFYRHFRMRSGKPEPRPGLILDAVSVATGVDVEEIKSHRRPVKIAFARQVAVYLMMMMTGHSSTQIGVVVGGRDHTTILHARDKIARLIAEDDDCQAARLVKACRLAIEEDMQGLLEAAKVQGGAQ